MLEKKTGEPLPGKTPTAYLPYFTSLPLVQCLPMHTAPPAPSTLPVILLPCYRCSLTRVEVVLTPDHSPRPPIPLPSPQSMRAASKNTRGLTLKDCSRAKQTHGGHRKK